jgi:hypothetical protein
MQRPSFTAALTAAAVAIAVATVINAVLTLVAGDTLVVPGELGLAQVVIFTAVMVIPAALVLWWRPRWLPATAIAVAVLTLPFPVMEFGSPIAWWLGVMHLITGVCAAVIAPWFAAR